MDAVTTRGACLNAPRWWLAASLWFALPAVATGQDESHRDEWQRVPDVLVALGAGPGAHVADIGAGRGYFTHHLRHALGETGRVYAVDISRTEVARLRAELDRDSVRNVDVILGQADDPRLPYGSLNGVLIVNAYHEMTEHGAMLAAVRPALRPAGRLVILDIPPPDSVAGRAAQTERHQIHIDLVAGELVQAGFQVLQRDPGFVADAHEDHDHRMWLLVSRRPLKDPPTQRLAGAPPGPDGLFACPFRERADVLAERLSPPDSVETRVGGARIKVCYSRPAARGRTIMGELVPFGTPWRTGANEATALRTDHPIAVGEIALAPGWYSLYTVPEPDVWTVAVNRLADRDGIVVDEWVRSHDEGRFPVPVEHLASPIESLTMRFEAGSAEAASLVIEWEQTRVRVPVRVRR